MTLNVNIDHVATVRNARGGMEPDPVNAALRAELAGASGIVCHLREDRRHINDRDLRLLRELVTTKLDLEMAASDEIIGIALLTLPDMVTIVPEKRQELTTEGGLDVANDLSRFKSLCEKMHDKNIDVSFFIEPDKKQIDAVLECGGDMVEFHTGTYANLKAEEDIAKEIERIRLSALTANAEGLRIAAGHGLNYFNIKPLCRFNQINEFSIGHSIISRAIFYGIENSVSKMIEIINESK